MEVNGNYPIQATAFQYAETNKIKPKVNLDMPNDSYDSSSKIEKAPKISGARIMFNLLTDEQIEQINKSKQLPDNAKFVMNGNGGYSIRPNMFGLTIGTQTLPEGFEVKKNRLGIALVLPKGTNGLMIK